MEQVQAMPLESIRKMVLSSLMAALITVGAYIAVPMPLLPVPVVLQNMMVFLTGLFLGWRWAGVTVAVYLLAGALGLPVFAKGGAGWGHIVGPTGGFLVGYLPAVMIVGLISGEKNHKVWRDVLAMVAGTAVIYFLGLAWLKHMLSDKALGALALGMMPYLAGDAVKIIAAAAIAKSVRTYLDSSASNPAPPSTPEA